MTVFSELLEQKRAIFKEDEFLAVFGKVSEDRFSGGLRLNADDALDIAEARLHFGQHIAFSLPEKFSPSVLKGMAVSCTGERHASDRGLCRRGKQSQYDFGTGGWFFQRRVYNELHNDLKMFMSFIEELAGAKPVFHAAGGKRAVTLQNRIFWRG